MIIDRTSRAVARTLGARRELRSAALPPTAPLVVGVGQDGTTISWPTTSREHASHLLVLGGSGSGKTTLMAHGLVQEAALQGRGPAPPALLIQEVKGDLIQTALQGLAAEVPELLPQVRVLDPFSSPPGFAFNLVHLRSNDVPADIRALQLAYLAAEVSTGTGAQAHLGVGARQIDTLLFCFLGALTTGRPEANILWALDALMLPRGLKRLASITSSARARLFLESAELNDELRASCASRIRLAFAATESLEQILSAPACIDFAELLAPGSVCILDLSRPPGGLVALQTFYANLFARLALEALLARPSPWSGHHCRMVFDEAQVVAPVLADIAERALTTGRSRGLSLVLASQSTALLHEASPTLLTTIQANTPTKFIGRLAAPDAELLAREQAPARGIDDTLMSVRGRFTGFVTNLEDREFIEIRPGMRRRFRTSDVDLARWEGAAEVHAEALAAARNWLALPASTARRVTLADVVPDVRRQRGRGRSPSANGRSSSTANAPTNGTAVANGTAPPRSRRPRSQWG